MTVDERQQLVERYVSGEMTANEASEFRATVDADVELRRLLSAEHVIAGAFARDRSMQATPALEPSEGLMSALQAGRAVATLRPAASPSWFNGTAATVAGVIGLIGISVGTLLVAPMLNESNHRGDNTVQESTSRDRSDRAANPVGPATGDGVSSSSIVEVAPRVADATRAEGIHIPVTQTHMNRSSKRSISRPAIPIDADAALGSRTAQSPTPSSSSPTSTSAADGRPIESLPQFDEAEVKIEVKVGVR